MIFSLVRCYNSSKSCQNRLLNDSFYPVFFLSDSSFPSARRPTKFCQFRVRWSCKTYKKTDKNHSKFAILSFSPLHGRQERCFVKWFFNLRKSMKARIWGRKTYNIVLCWDLKSRHFYWRSHFSCARWPLVIRRCGLLTFLFIYLWAFLFFFLVEKINVCVQLRAKQRYSSLNIYKISKLTSRNYWILRRGGLPIH